MTAHSSHRFLAKLLLGGSIVLALASIFGVSTSLAAGKCYGAAARDPKRPCINRTLSVTPTLAAARRERTSPCALTAQKPAPICTFGTSAAKARGHFALIGDSHALHWRPALDVVARAKRWQGHSITAPGCFFTAAVDAMADGAREPCVAWYRATRAWLKKHTEVSTVFVSQNDADTPLLLGPGESSDDVRITGFGQAWRAMPRHVKRVIVIRDTPITPPATLGCVQRVIEAGVQRAGPTCALPRTVALRKDFAVSAVLRLRAKRFKYVDLTRFFCGDRTCYPVIGGALVHRDALGHLTKAYSYSLGPYLLRKARWLMRAR